MKWVKPFAIGYEYVYFPDKVNNLTAERLLTVQPIFSGGTDASGLVL